MLSLENWWFHTFSLVPSYFSCLEFFILHSFHCSHAKNLNFAVPGGTFEKTHFQFVIWTYNNGPNIFSLSCSFWCVKCYICNRKCEAKWGYTNFEQSAFVSGTSLRSDWRSTPQQLQINCILNICRNRLRCLPEFHMFTLTNTHSSSLTSIVYCSKMRSWRKMSSLILRSWNSSSIWPWASSNCCSTPWMCAMELQCGVLLVDMAASLRK